MRSLHTDIGRCPATHACFKSRDMLVQTDVDCNFKCKECNACYPTWRSLSNHNKEHTKQKAQDKYNVKNNLPTVYKFVYRRVDVSTRSSRSSTHSPHARTSGGATAAENAS